MRRRTLCLSIPRRSTAGFLLQYVSLISDELMSVGIVVLLLAAYAWQVELWVANLERQLDFLDEQQL